MPTYTVSWTIEIDCDGDHKAAAQFVADQHFSASIAEGRQDTESSFVVIDDADMVPVHIDLADSLSDLDNDEYL